MIKKLTKFISPLSLFHPFRLTRGTAYLFAQLQNCRMFTTAIQTSSVSVLEPWYVTGLVDGEGIVICGHEWFVRSFKAPGFRH